MEYKNYFREARSKYQEDKSGHLLRTRSMTSLPSCKPNQSLEQNREKTSHTCLVQHLNGTFDRIRNPSVALWKVLRRLGLFLRDLACPGLVGILKCSPEIRVALHSSDQSNF